MWQLDSAITSASSGLGRAASPRYSGAEEASSSAPPPKTQRCVRGYVSYVNDFSPRIQRAVARCSDMREAWASALPAASAGAARRIALRAEPTEYWAVAIRSGARSSRPLPMARVVRARAVPSEDASAAGARSEAQPSEVNRTRACSVLATASGGFCAERDAARCSDVPRLVRALRDHDVASVRVFERLEHARVLPDRDVVLLVQLAGAGSHRAHAHQRRHHQVLEAVDVPRRQLGVDARGARLDQALQEVLGVDADVLEHLEEARVALALAPAVHASL